MMAQHLQHLCVLTEGSTQFITMNEKQQAHGTGEKLFASRVWIVVGIVSITIVLLWLFKALFSLVLLTFASAMVAIYFLGFADLVQRLLHVSYGWAKTISVVFNVILLIAFFCFIGGRLSQQISSLSDTFPQTIQHAKEQISQSDLGKKALEKLQSPAASQKLKAVAGKLFSSSYGALSDLYIVLLISIFFITSPSLYRRGIVHLLPSKAKDEAERIIEKLYQKQKSWLKGQIIGVFFIGILTGIGLWILGMPLVLTLALIAGVLNVIPNFGPLIALIPAVLIAFMQGPNTALIVILIYQGVQIIQSAVMQPIVQKKMVSMPPALIIIGQIAMGTLGGFWGLLLATPAVVVIMTIVNDVYVKKQSYRKYQIK